MANDSVADDSVTVNVDLDPTKTTSAINMSEEDAALTNVCIWGGAQYSPGAWICWGGSKMVCQQNGTWKNVGACR